MTSRSLYRQLLRLHPLCFRKQFEDQMMSIFDESVQSRGALSLLLDATVSLFRQWILRSGYWRHAKPGLPVDGAIALEALRRNSQSLYRKAWWLHAFWTVGAFAVCAMCPLPFWQKSPFGFFAGWAVVRYWYDMRGRSAEDRYFVQSLDLDAAPRNHYRTRLEEKRDGLRSWLGKNVTWIVLMALMQMLLLIVRPLIQNYRGVPNTGFDWDHSRWFVYGAVVLGTTERFVKGLNDRAAQAFQDEIEATDGPSDVGNA